MGQQHKIHSTRVQMSPKGESRDTSDQLQSLIQHRSQSRCGKQHSCDTRHCNDMGDVRRSGWLLLILHRAHRAGIVKRRKFSDAQQVLQIALTLCPRLSTASFHPLPYKRPWRSPHNFSSVLSLASARPCLTRALKQRIHALGLQRQEPHELRPITQQFHASFPLHVPLCCRY